MCLKRFFVCTKSFSAWLGHESFDTGHLVAPELVVVVAVVSSVDEGRLKQPKRWLVPVPLTLSGKLEPGFSVVKVEQILSQTYLPTKGTPFSKSKFHFWAFSSLIFLFSRSKSALICSWFTGPNNCLQTERLGIMFGLTLRGQDGGTRTWVAVISCGGNYYTSISFEHSLASCKIRNCNK